MDWSYRRRPTVQVAVGNTFIGSDYPVRLQSMASTSTMDTENSVAQALRLVDAGAELVRFTAQGVREADNLGVIRGKLRDMGVNVPLVADIHFNPRAAFAAAGMVEKVRINPGNFVDPGRTFKKIEYTDSEYAAELRRLEEELKPFIDTCRKNGTAVRLGVNHGSLSDRIMSRYGDTPEGMVESAMEFLRVFTREGFDDVVISIKASNVMVMVRTVRLLVDTMDREDMHYPLHLGVTEAGDGEDGRIKSALGIGSLLALGIGDTIRVSLSEEPERELPVARSIYEYAAFAGSHPLMGDYPYADGHPFPTVQRRHSAPIGSTGGVNPPVVAVMNGCDEFYTDAVPDVILDTSEHKFLYVDAEDILGRRVEVPDDTILILSTAHPAQGITLLAAMHTVVSAGLKNPVILSVHYEGVIAEKIPLYAAMDLGPALLSGFADGIMVQSDILDERECAKIAFGILQSSRQRITRTEFISCPGCGRTLFNLQDTLAKVKAATKHLKGLKIAVMGCIVNGPGEMADADYGYVGAGCGRISLYKGKQCVRRNIPESEAVSELVKLIKDSGEWNEG